MGRALLHRLQSCCFFKELNVPYITPPPLLFHHFTSIAYVSSNPQLSMHVVNAIPGWLLQRWSPNIQKTSSNVLTSGKLPWLNLERQFLTPLWLHKIAHTQLAEISHWCACVFPGPTPLAWGTQGQWPWLSHLAVLSHLGPGREQVLNRCLLDQGPCKIHHCTWSFTTKQLLPKLNLAFIMIHEKILISELDHRNEQFRF